MKLKTYQLFNSMTPIFLVFMLVFTGLSLKAQVKLGGNWSSANPNAVLDLEASDKGLLLPRVSTATRSSTLANAPAGLVVYDTDLNRLMIKQGPDAASWAALSMSATLPDTLKGLVGIFNSGLVGNNRSPVLTVTNGSTGIQGNRLANFTRPITTAGGKSVLLLGKDSTSKNGAWIGYTHAGDNNNNNTLSFGFPGRADIVSVGANGNVNFLNTQLNQQGSSDENDRYSITSFYHWNLSSTVAYPIKYGSILRLGQIQGPNKYLDSYADIELFVPTTVGAASTWNTTLGFKLKNKSYFLTFDNNQKLILGKGDQANKSMLINATAATRVGVVSIGHQNPDASALLDLNFAGTSDDLGKGLLLPRYSTTTLNDNNFYQPATGLLAFDQTLNRVVMNIGTPAARDWQPLLTASDTLYFWATSNRINQQLGAGLNASTIVGDTLKTRLAYISGQSVSNNNTPILSVSNTATGIQGNRLANFTRPIATAGGKSVLLLGKDSTSKNGAWIGYTHAGNNNNNNALSFGFTGREDIVSINGYGNVRFTNTQFNQPGHADENNRYSTTSFYHWNKADIVGTGAEYAQTLRIGQYQGSNKSSDKYADILMSLYTPTNDASTWVHKVEHSLSGKSWFLRFDSNQNLILGKGDQDLRSMYLYATGTLNKGLVSMGHRNPDASAVLDLNYQGPSDDLGRGLLLPRYSTATLNNANFYQPATGLLAFDQTKGRVVMNAGTPASRDWQPMVLGTSGSVTFSGTTVTVTDTSVKANSVIILTSQSGDGGKLFVSGRSAGSSFEITSDIPSSKTVGYLIIN